MRKGKKAEGGRGRGQGRRMTREGREKMGLTSSLVAVYFNDRNVESIFCIHTSRTGWGGSVIVARKR